MAECPRWEKAESDARLPSVVEGLSDFHRFALRKAQTHILNHGDLKTWHGRIFRDVVPLSYYAGNYRSTDAGRPCLSQNVEVGGSPGAPYQDVPRLMEGLSDEMRDAVTRTDRYIASNPTPADRARAVVQLAALYAGKFIQIHPFLNGNGRMSRLIANYMFYRYGYPFPYYDPYPRPGVDYEAANRECMLGDYVPLYRYFLTLLGSKSPK